MPHGKKLLCLSAIKKAVVVIQQIIHWNLVEAGQLVHDRGRVMEAGSVFHVKVERGGNTHLGCDLFLHQAEPVTVPAQPIGNRFDLVIGLVLPLEPLCIQRSGGDNQPEGVDAERCKSGSSQADSAQNEKVRGNPDKETPTHWKLEKLIRFSS